MKTPERLAFEADFLKRYPNSNSICENEWRGWQAGRAQPLPQAQVDQIAWMVEGMRPAGGRAWTEGQAACYEALTAAGEGIRALGGTVLPQAPSAPTVTLHPITSNIMVDESGERPAFCVMAAFRSEAEARAALQAMGSAVACRTEPQVIAEFLERSGKYLTNDATRRAALVDAWEEGFKSPRRTGKNPYK